MTPTRITLSRAKGWRKPEGAIVVSRPSIWGNPFRAGEPDYPTQQRAVDRFEASLTFLSKPHPDSHMGRILSRLPELRGHDLCCWCKPGEPCHADILIRMANE